MSGQPSVDVGDLNLKNFRLVPVLMPNQITASSAKPSSHGRSPSRSVAEAGKEAQMSRRRTSWEWRRCVGPNPSTRLRSGVLDRIALTAALAQSHSKPPHDSKVPTTSEPIRTTSAAGTTHTSLRLDARLSVRKARPARQCSSLGA